MAIFKRISENPFEVSSELEVLVPVIGHSYVFGKRLCTSEVTEIIKNDDKEIHFKTKKAEFKILK